MTNKLTLDRRALLAASAGMALVLAMTGAAPAQDQVSMTFLVDNNPDTVAVAEKLVSDFEAKNPNINIDVETRPGGTDGDNIVKTRLATGDMPDLFLYNSGSLFQAINPQQNLTPLTDEPFEANVLDSFKKVVSSGGEVYGVPIQTAMGGGILYNKKIYSDLGLSVPMTWDDFMANNEKIKAAGKVPVIQTYGTTWTSQLFVLGDFYNVLAADPDFADKYTANEAKYADTPAALKGFEHLAGVYKAGDLNEDFQAATYEEGLAKLANGEGAHYPMLTFAVGAIQTTYPDKVQDVGFFAIPGDDPENVGLTTWMPAGVYIPKTAQHPDEAKAFLGYIASTDGCDSQTAAVGATGPYLIKDCTLPDDVPPAVADLLPYFQEGGHNAPALEFLSPIKGPSLEQITVEVGSGIRSAADGAALYDQDVEKQARQLGLEGW